VTQVPPWWPEPVHHPGAPDWHRSAVSWLLDLVPGDWREHDVLRRHPTLLARLAAGQTAASLEATREGWRTLRRDVGRGGAKLPPEVVDEAMAAYERQGARLVELTRQIDAVRQAIDGFTWVPGAGRWTPARTGPGQAATASRPDD
jgi:hypothetical protein